MIFNKVMLKIPDIQLKKYTITGLWAALLLFFLVLPVRFGGSSLPIIGQGEKIANTYAIELIRKAQDSYLVMQALDGALAVAQTAEFNAGAFGVGMSAAPGAILSPVQDSVKTLADFFSNIVFLTLIEKQAMGMITWVCIKVLLPLGILALIINRFTSALPGVCAVISKFALCAWLLLPVTGLLGIIINDSYIQPKYDANVERIKKEMAQVFPGIERIAAKQSLRDTATAVIAEWNITKRDGESSIAMIKEMAGKLKTIAQKPDNLVSLMMLTFSQLAVLAYVLPFLTLLIFFGICKTLCNPQ